MFRGWRILVLAGVLVVLVGLFDWAWRAHGFSGLSDVVGDIANLAGVIGVVIAVWRFAVQPAVADRGSPGRSERRRRLAGNIERQLLLAFEQGDWSDERYAELRAESQVEILDQDESPLWRSVLGLDTLLRRERPLTRTLLGMRSRVVILEGDPGAGKSVALRHLALRLARAAARPRGSGGPVPVYINLKDFRPAGGTVDSESVRAFIYDTLIASDRGIAGFLDAEFGDPLTAGEWTLLFDSFDEIPAVLGAAAEADEVVGEYSKAIIDFTENHGFRAVIASREFRGPRGFALPRLRIVRLTARQQRDLIRRSGLPRDMAATAVTEIARVGPDLRQLADNPLFLWLVCQYLRDNDGAFPDSAYGVFDSYVRHRLTADDDRLREGFGVGAELIRAHAEQYAFSMASSADLGLSPAVGQLKATIAALPAPSPPRARDVPAVLDALESLKLGRYETSPSEPGVKRFTFTHRRLQEYFATCAVFRRPDEVPPKTLLTDGHWRETAVATFQTQPPDAIDPLLAAAREMLTELADHALSPADLFTWPPGLLHLLDVLAAGLGRAPERIPGDIRDLAGQVLTRAGDKGSRPDRLWACEVARVACEEVTSDLLVRALGSRSRLLQETALHQAAWLGRMPPAAEPGFRRLLVGLWASGELAGRSPVIAAQLRRFPQATTLSQSLLLLRWVVRADIVALAVIAGIWAAIIAASARSLLGDEPAVFGLWFMAVSFVTHVALHLDRAGIAVPASHSLRIPRRLLASRGTFTAQPSRKSANLRLLGAYQRIFPLLILLPTIADTSPSSMTSSGPRADMWLLGGLVTGYLLMWPYAAVGQVLADGRVPLWSWPLLPARWAGRNVLRLLRALGRLSVRQWLTVLGGLIGFVLAAALGALVIAPIAPLESSSLSPAELTAFLTGYGLAVTSILVLAIVGIVTELRRWARRRAVIRAVRRRKTPYQADEMVASLSRFYTSAGVRELAQTLRLTPALCPPEVTSLFADLLRAAERYSYRPARRGGLREGLRRRPPELSLPPGSGTAFTAWAEQNPRQLTVLLRVLDEETMDEITRLIDAARRP